MQDALLALPLGALIGLSLGMLGAGGSILTVPALVLLIGQTPHEAAATSLVVVGSIAATGALAHRRRGSVRLRAGLAFAATGAVSSLLASYVSLQTDPDLLALGFSAVMLAAATAMWRSARAGARPAPDGIEAEGDEREATASSPAARRHGRVGRTLLAGALVGLLTGFFGIGGGFLAVPALIFALGLDVTTAVGTSLVVIALNAAVALVPRITGDLVDPAVTVVFVVGGAAGALAGTHAAHRLPQRRLKGAFAVIVVITSVALASSTLAG